MAQATLPKGAESAIKFPAGIYYDGNKGTTFVIVILYLFWGSIFLHIFDMGYYYFSWSFLMLFVRRLSQPPPTAVSLVSDCLWIRLLMVAPD